MSKEKWKKKSIFAEKLTETNAEEIVLWANGAVFIVDDTLPRAEWTLGFNNPTVPEFASVGFYVVQHPDGRCFPVDGVLFEIWNEKDKA